MKKNRLIALVLVLILALTGCGNSGSSAQTKAGTGGASGSTGEAAGTPESVLKDGNMTELTVVFPGGTSSPASQEKVEEQLNAIIAPYIDATVKLKIIEWGVFADQQNLMLSSGEDVALMFTFDSTSKYAASNQVIDITDLCDTYAKDALDALGIYGDACRISGKLYGLPTFHEYTSSAGLICRTDLLEEMGIDPAQVKTWDDIESILAKAKEAYPTMNLLCPSDDTYGIMGYANEGIFDRLTDGVGVYAGKDDTTVINLYDTPEFMDLAKKAYEWNQKGYIMADATTTTNTRSELLAAGNTFGYIGMIHPGTATQELKNAGVPVTTLPVNTGALTTSKVNFSQYMVPTACSAPEKAVKLLDLILTNADIANLLSYGIEGTDYVIKDSENDIAGYPDGVDSSNVGWNNETWLVGNGALAHVWESDPPTIWKDYEEFNASATVSPLYGFTFDTSNVKTEITAITNVIQKYQKVIYAGYSDPEESVKKMLDELDSAGIGNVIDDAKKQVEEWKAAN